MLVKLTTCLPFSSLHCLLDYYFVNSISMTPLFFLTEKSDNLLSKYDSIESDLEIVEKFDEFQLNETCVLVEEDRIHVPQGPVKQKSYKVDPLSSSLLYISFLYLFLQFAF